MNIINRVRYSLAYSVENNKIKNINVSIIADDCWASEYYRRLRIPYQTPTVGLWVEPAEYMNFLENLRSAGANALEFIPSETDYPVAKTPYATLHFMHFSDEAEAVEKFGRRWERINWQAVSYKVDFGKNGYTKADVERWNAMKLPRSVALVSPDKAMLWGPIHNQVIVPDWDIDGNRMFDLSRRHFDFYNWLNRGKIRQHVGVKLFHLAIVDSHILANLKSKLTEK